MKVCPLCQTQLVPTQYKPLAMECPNSYLGNGHLFQYLCWEDGNVHSYKYNLLGWQITYWPSPQHLHVVIRSANNLEHVIYAGKANKNFVDFPGIIDYLKLLNTFS